MEEIALPESRTIKASADLDSVRRMGAAIGREQGFSAFEIGEIELIVSELATNVLRFGLGGMVTIVAVREDNRAGIRITAEDRGPGISDVGLAFSPGYSSVRSLGQGLPIVSRLASDVDVVTGPTGTLIIATKWRK